LKGGNRLPWLAAPENYAALDGVHWGLHIYGLARAELVAVAQVRGFRVSVFETGAAAYVSSFQDHEPSPFMSVKIWAVMGLWL
jgi:hypothetical protein